MPIAAFLLVKPPPWEYSLVFIKRYRGALNTKGRFGSVLRAAILTRKAALDAAAGAIPNSRAFLAKNHVTGIKRTNGTQTNKMGVNRLF
jgi:hypothetical protein